MLAFKSRIYRVDKLFNNDSYEYMLYGWTVVRKLTFPYINTWVEHTENTNYFSIRNDASFVPHWFPSTELCKATNILVLATSLDPPYKYNCYL